MRLCILAPHPATLTMTDLNICALIVLNGASNSPVRWDLCVRLRFYWLGRSWPAPRVFLTAWRPCTVLLPMDTRRFDAGLVMVDPQLISTRFHWCSEQHCGVDISDAILS